jgi:hypothetical protein
MARQEHYTNTMPLPPKDKEDHDWMYVSNQQPNEVNFLKLFDSEAWKASSEVMPYGAHSAFVLPGQGTKPPRKSIEVRVIVIW